MFGFVIEKHRKQPDWALMLMATFPYDRKKRYPSIERPEIMGVVLNYLEEFTYRKRNTMQRLGDTHIIRCKKNSITIATVNYNPVLTIHLIADN